MEPGFTTLIDCHVGIVGLGLMGGSLALALRGANACRSISGHDVDPITLDQAIERGVIDQPIDWTNGPIDLLILAAPVNAILAWIVRLPTIHSGALHVLDLGSTKAQIVEAMRQLPDDISTLGGHPMCGKEASGLDAVDGNLYRNQVFVLTPLGRTLRTTLSLAQELIAAIGARPLILDPDQHDQIAAAISHVPYLASIALVDAAIRLKDEVAWTMAASGFRDSTRLAASDVTMMLDILTSNRAVVLDALSRVQSTLHELAALIEQGHDVELRERLDATRLRRATLFKP